jgi:hypothetical protein
VACRAVQSFDDRGMADMIVVGHAAPCRAFTRRLSSKPPGG